MKKYLSNADLIVIVITFLLFTIALFTKGFTHDLLLEAGVLLVSIKIIMMNHKNTVSNTVIMKDLDEIKQTLHEIKTNQCK
ncbi:MAG: hypothetical protein JW830_08185 [Bacteroidales bacterium]|nr:hypothetical protein [Bacteroidales bacterium]